MFEFSVEGSVVQVVVASGILNRSGQEVSAAVGGSAGVSALVVSDSNVGPLYGEQLASALSQAGFEVSVHEIPAGEASKSLAELGRLYDALLAMGLDRQGLVVAVGGGVVSDLAGFAAATWKRGVRFVVVPTTLESAVDACLGGKTAVNLSAGKNVVGAFHWPEAILVDPECMHTLPRAEVVAAFAESIKHALIFSNEWLGWHEDHVEPLLSLESSTVCTLIDRNLRMKAAVVEVDPRERLGRRMFLNFGHTVGHAIESAMGYRRRHGECVGLGMLAALRMSSELGLIEADVRSRLMALMHRLGLPTAMPAGVAIDEVFRLMKRDKKNIAGNVRFVLLEGVGQPVLRDDVDGKIVAEAVAELVGG